MVMAHRKTGVVVVVVEGSADEVEAEAEEDLRYKLFE